MAETTNADILSKLDTFATDVKARIEGLATDSRARDREQTVERTRFWCAFEIRRRGDDALIATCRQMLALIQMPQGRPMRLPAEWAERYAHLKNSSGPAIN